MTVSARRSLRIAGVQLPADIRIGRVTATLAISLVGLLLFLHVPPFMAAGADMSDGGQRDYAANIWQETQTSLALVALVLPWLVYGLLWPGAPWGRRVVLAVSTAAVVVTTWMALISVQSYVAVPRQVTGIIQGLQGRVITLRDEGSYYLVISDEELRGDQAWLQPGVAVLLWVSPRDQAAAVSRVSLGD